MHDLRLGRWQDALADVERVDVVCVDPPYGPRTHAGNKGMRDRFGAAARRDLTYAHWLPEDVHEFVESWSPRCDGWFIAMTSDDLCASWREAFEEAGRYHFAPVPIIQPRVRLGGDGPASCAVYLMASRPRERRFLGWGALPGWYRAPIDRSGHIGGKPVSLMRQILRDYSRSGQTVCDPCAGFGSTLLAAREMGRRFVGSEMDPNTFAKAQERLAQPFTPAISMDVPRVVQSAFDLSVPEPEPEPEDEVPLEVMLDDYECDCCGGVHEEVV